MAAIGIALVGAGIGGAIGGTFTAAMIGYSIGSMVGSLLFPPDLGTVRGPRLNDLQVQSSAEGVPIYKAYGSVRLAGNIIWGKPLQEHKHKEKSGGKGGGGGQTSITYTYTADFALALCEGPVTAIRKLWADGKLIMDLSEPTAAEQAIADGGGFLGNVLERQQAFFGQTLSKSRSGASIRMYNGSETQMPDPLIEADLGAGNAPAYRGVCYIVFDNLELADFGNRIPNITAEVVVAGETRIAYLGKAGPWDALSMPSPLYPDDARVEMYSHYVRPNKTLAAVSWAHSFATTSVVSTDPVYIHSSGVQQIGKRHILVGDAPISPLAGYCDAPAYFSYTVGAAELYLYEVSGSPASGVLIGHFKPPVAGGFSTLNDSNTASAAWYVGGDVWVYVAGTGEVHHATPAGATLAAGEAVTTEVHGNVTALVAGAIRSVWVGEEEVFVVSGSSNPYTLTVIDREPWTVLRTASLPITPDTGAGNQPSARAYSSKAGLVYLYYTEAGTGTEKLYVVDGTQGRALGSVLNTALNVDASYNFCVQDGILAVFDDQWTTVVAGGDTSPALGGIRYWSVESIGADTVPLSTIVADVCNRCGLDSGLINVTDLASTDVRGYLRDAQMAGRSAIEPLANAYRFDAVESDGILKFIRRGTASVRTLTVDDLGAGAEGAAADKHVTVIEQDTELPIEFNVQYIDAERDYQVGSQRSRRLVPDSEKISSLRLPVVFTGTEAKKTAEVLQYLGWAERKKYSFSLLPKHLDLDAGDIVTIPVNNVSTRTRLTSVSFGAVVECEAVADDASIYVSNASAAATTSAQQTISVVGETITALLDIPILRDLDDNAGFYVAATGTGSGWHGAALYRSEDQLVWAEAGVLTVAADMGTCVTALPTGPTTIFDDGNTVDVMLFSGTLESVTELQALAGTNTAAIGSPANGWELVTFQNATLQGDGSWRLSRLLRGRRGTEWAIGSHVIGDMFVLLESGVMARPVPATSDINVDRYYRGVSFGGSLTEADTLTYRHQAVGKEPYAVAHITGRRHTPATNDWTVDWIRRGRVDGDWRDYVDVPLGESSESYEAEIMNGSVVVRTITATTQTAVYTVAQQITDFGAAQPTISVRVYQLSATVGRGYVSTAQFTLAASLVEIADLHMDGTDGSTTFTDSFGKRTVTVGGSAQIDTAQSYEGGASALFANATQDYLRFDGHTDWQFGAEDFTVHFWVRKSAAGSAGSSCRLFQLRDGDVYSGFSLSDNSAGTNNLQFYASSNGASWDLVSAGDIGPLALDTWTHIAIERYGVNLTVYKGGSSIGSWNIGSATLAWNVAWQPILGGQSGGTNRSLTGWIDKFYAVRGTALYKGPFTP